MQLYQPLRAANKPPAEPAVLIYRELFCRYNKGITALKHKNGSFVKANAVKNVKLRFISVYFKIIWL